MSALREALEEAVNTAYRCGANYVMCRQVTALLAAYDDPPAPVGVERVEWAPCGRLDDGREVASPWFGTRSQAEESADRLRRLWTIGNAPAELVASVRVVRRTVTSYPDVVGEWEEVGR